MSDSQAQARDDEWLDERFNMVRDSYFRNLPPGLPIHIGFGRAARLRFGSIAARHGICRITINGLFRNDEIPAYVVDATIAHELCHYVHGYGSGLPRLHAHPHRGGVIDAEMARRGCLSIEMRAHAWRNQHWSNVVSASPTLSVPRALRASHASHIWEAYLARPGFRTTDDLNALAQRIAARFGMPQAPFTVDWLHASLRVRTLSYFRPDEARVVIHGLLADPSVPSAIIEMEIGYWVAAQVVGNHADAVAVALEARGMGAVMRKSVRWHQNRWAKWRTSHHPLGVCPAASTSR